MASVEIKNVGKVFGGTQVIRDISIEINDGQFTVLVGPSGCGKSTLLRMIAGLEEISEGEILIGDKRVNEMPPKERDIAMVFQNYALYPHMTVYDNMAFSLKLAKKDSQTIQKQIEGVAEILGLTALLKRYPKQLSGGQRQRVAMGRAIVRNPQVFLFDEPLSNLDAKLRVQMRTEIKALHQRLSTTSIYVTHDQIEAMTMADKIVVMREGRVEQMGSPLDLYDHPVNTFVAGFIGSPAMNFLDGIVRKKDSVTYVEFTAGNRLEISSDFKVHDGQPVIYGIRPEDLALTNSDGIVSEVIVVEPTGAETQVFSKISEIEITAMFRERYEFKPGEKIRLKPLPGKSHLFDKESGRSLN